MKDSEIFSTRVFMQSPDNKFPEYMAVRPKGLIKHPHQFLTTDKWRRYKKPEENDIEAQPTKILPTIPVTPQVPYWDGAARDDPDAAIPRDIFDMSSMSTMRLMEVSGMMRAVRLPANGGLSQGGSPVGGAWNPYSGQQAGSLSMGNGYWGEPFAQVPSPPYVPVAPSIVPEMVQGQPARKTILSNPALKVVLGLLIGVGMLFLISRFVNIATTVSVLGQHLTTTQGVVYALLAAASFISAFSIRGARWRLFLRRICDISTLKAIQVFWVAVFLNFLLPVQGGELAKSLILKRIKRVPVSQSLPTVAMDKSLDLMPALIIMATVPFIPDIHMSATLWIVLGLVSSILFGIIFTVALMAWNRAAATKFIQMMLKVLPKGIGKKIEGFALGFVDSLLAGASNPKTFIPAVLLTCLAVTCDGLFAWFAFLTVGVSNMGFGTAIFGYTTYNMFSILPTPPGQVGSNELVGVIVFGGLLGFPKTSVLAMFVFSHPLAALIMTTMCMICLSGLGISLTSAMKINSQKDDESKAPLQAQRTAVRV
jgi:uncharacterized protein (TIRG00374 family)